MEMKKSKHAQLGRKRGQFLTIGFIVALALTISAFEWKSYDNIICVDITRSGDYEIPDIIPPTVHDVPKPPKPKIIKDIIEVVKEVKADELIDIIIDDFEFENFNPEDFDEPIIEEVELPFIYVEDMPEFEGGKMAFMKHIAKQVKYPRLAKNLGIEGRVFVEFVIDKEGNITEVKAVKGIGAGCDEEAVRVIKNAPKWKPGKQRGKPVKVKMVLPINFKLNK